MWMLADAHISNLGYLCLTYVPFNHVNKIEARYKKVLSLNEKLSEQGPYRIFEKKSRTFGKD